MSCKGVATGIDSETHPDELMANLRSPQAPILFARMLGKSTAALITFDGLEVPRTIYYYGGELLCRPYRPLSQVCSICLKTGHRADICPTPESARCKNCGHENPSEDHQCQPKCVLCEGDHPVTDPSCPARQRKPFNKSHFLRNAGYTSDANNVPTTTNPGSSTNQPKTPGSKSPPASTETNVDRGRSPRRSTDSKKRDKSRDASASRSQSLPRTKTPRHERHEAATNEQGAESRSTIDMVEKSERKALTKGPGTNPPKSFVSERKLEQQNSPVAERCCKTRLCGQRDKTASSARNNVSIRDRLAEAPDKAEHRHLFSPMPALLLYVITLVVRFLAGVVTDLGLLIGVYFSMKALIIVNVVWKGTGAIFDIVHGATFFPLVYQQLRQLIGYEETLNCTLYLSLALLMILTTDTK
ncbi:hypothetical protein HPB49_024958 [Dermacentor silvarum]|uniref:Uncharacterized protein n=1 Tax=Dermacentor silvarum TaxID=543639 RepID=A0ACB8DHJ9_DERSI|nr:hypothetical protein HPB49_024958 [Dermacentor silvarum]